MFFLYQKTHLDTGLKYLGQTKQNPHRYTGSGLYWKNHLKCHGNNVETIILKECTNKDDLEYWGIYYSNLWNIVESAEWANLKPETGDGGSTKGRIFKNGSNKRKLDSNLKTSATMKGRPAHNKGKKQSHKPHKSRIDNKELGISKLKGVPRPKLCCLSCKTEVDPANFARYHKH
jgi:hypothetical protein